MRAMKASSQYDNPITVVNVGMDRSPHDDPGTNLNSLPEIDLILFQSEIRMKGNT